MKTLKDLQAKFYLKDEDVVAIRDAIDKKEVTLPDLHSRATVTVYFETPEEFATRELKEYPDSWEDQEQILEELKNNGCYVIGDGYIIATSL